MSLIWPKKRKKSEKSAHDKKSRVRFEPVTYGFQVKHATSVPRNSAHYVDRNQTPQGGNRIEIALSGR